jgi:NADPH:quinone reductase-like Zn-dependent oxidoreductase
MQAAVCTRYGPPEVLRLAEVDQPVPGPGERYDLVFVAVGDRVGPPSRKRCRRILAGAYVAVDRGRPVVSAEDLKVLTSLAEAGELTPVIDRRYPLAQLAEVHRYVEAGHKKGNVVVAVSRTSP